MSMQNNIISEKIIIFALTLTLLSGIILTTEIAAEEEVLVIDSALLHVSNIEPVFVEKGASNYQVTLRAHITNNGNSESITADVLGKDKDGYILQNVRFSGNIEIGATRVLMERFQVRGETYNNITTWELRQ